MRCRPGDLCVVVKALLPADEALLGVFLTVTTQADEGSWYFEKASRPLYAGLTKTFPRGWRSSDDYPFVKLSVVDHCLQPIRPPAQGVGVRQAEPTEQGCPA